ncbi:MAG: hypothetical protein HZA88_04545 [Verrucomicrobia bacterium]|nr:hypothetical protein [Verrucomicrobiota bacterium]
MNKNHIPLFRTKVSKLSGFAFVQVPVVRSEQPAFISPGIQAIAQAYQSNGGSNWNTGAGDYLDHTRRLSGFMRKSRIRSKIILMG